MSRTLSAAAVIGLVSTFVAGVALQSSAATLEFVGTLEVAIGPIEGVTFTGAGVATVPDAGDALTTFALAGGEFSGATSIPITDPNASPLAGIQVEAVNAAGSFVDGGGGALGGVMGIPGMAVVCIFDPECGGINLTVPFTENQTRGVGIGPDEIAVGGDFIKISVGGDEWTVGTAKAFSSGIGAPEPVTVTGFAHGPASGGLSTANKAGAVVALVTPIQVTTDIGASSGIPAFAIMTLNLPEPGPLLLTSAAVLTLGVMGWQRARNRKR